MMFLEVLANCERSVAELVVDVNRESTKTAHQFFNVNSPNFQNSELIRSHGLRRPDLAINMADSIKALELRNFPTSFMTRALSN